MMAEPFSIVRARSEAPRARASVRIDLTKMIHLGQAAVPVLQPHLKMLELERMRTHCFLSTIERK
jgi:hypothetical protein